MMDYPAWRKKTPTPQFISYSNANRIDQLIQEDKPSTSAAAAAAAQNQTQKYTTQQPATAESSVVSGISTGTTSTAPLDGNISNNTVKTVGNLKEMHTYSSHYDVKIKLSAFLDLFLIDSGF